jgi:PAS domain S-box-containing protein
MGRYDAVVPAWLVLSVLGAGAIGVAVWHASTVDTIDALSLLALAPLFVAGGLLVSLGARLRTLPAGNARVAAWTVVAAIAVGGVADFVLAQEYGIVLPDSAVVVATVASTGAAAGAVGGFLAARQEAAVGDALARADRTEQFVSEANGVIIARLDPEGYIDAWSAGAEAITGYDAAEVLGSRVTGLYAGDDADEAVTTHLQRALRTDAVEIERTFERSDGEEFHGSGTLTAIRTDDQLLGYLLVLDDRSEERERRESLERRNSQLEAFASVVSHDLRNPLNVAIGSIGMAKTREEDNRSQLQAAEAALERMEQLIEDVLTLARQGKDVDEFERVELSETVQLAWGTIDQKQATMEAEDLSAGTADGERLRRLFENLFRNAIEHGGDDVEITVGMVGEEGFYVADDGPGIPEHKREEIFEAGYTTGDEGTGLGLAIVRSIVEAHDWEISAARSADGGAKFEIRGVQTLANVEP